MFGLVLKVVDRRDPLRTAKLVLGKRLDYPGFFVVEDGGGVELYVMYRLEKQGDIFIIRSLSFHCKWRETDYILQVDKK